ncbi:MAG TPA: rhodanese-like domain-containing protein [Gemmatales bacterium]|nr:rhodanese-like domain-containing protein [Gemmatales bacterium]
MKAIFLTVTALFLSVPLGFAQEEKYPKAKVSYDDFKGLVAEVESHRADRLIDFNTFLKMSQEEGVLILDTRSSFRYDRIHLKGARHLAFTDFTQENLAKVIPSTKTKILIYCNNNFDGNERDFSSKMGIIADLKPKLLVGKQFTSEAKPLMMALNVPTYINLYGYGYRNVYELDELVKVSDPRVKFEGSIVEQNPVTSARGAGKR